ncbi:MAG: hypothetical protein QF920_10810, partial [Verrucomicrobiota bacterium]|nr:hypothetical protein [Verrucomicrobiota bacterium]
VFVYVFSFTKQLCFFFKSQVRGGGAASGVFWGQTLTPLFFKSQVRGGGAASGVFLGPNK